MRFCSGLPGMNGGERCMCETGNNQNQNKQLGVYNIVISQTLENNGWFHDKGNEGMGSGRTLEVGTTKWKKLYS